MVIANDKMPDASSAPADSPDQASHTYVGTQRAPDTYNDPGPEPATGRAVTITRVTDDFGEHIEIRMGEAIILGPLLDSVLEELRAKQANEG